MLQCQWCLILAEEFNCLLTQVTIKDPCHKTQGEKKISAQCRGWCPLSRHHKNRLSGHLISGNQTIKEKARICSAALTKSTIDRSEVGLWFGNYIAVQWSDGWWGEAVLESGDNHFSDSCTILPMVTTRWEHGQGDMAFDDVRYLLEAELPVHPYDGGVVNTHDGTSNVYHYSSQIFL